MSIICRKSRDEMQATEVFLSAVGIVGSDGAIYIGVLDIYISDARDVHQTISSGDGLKTNEFGLLFRSYSSLLTLFLVRGH